MARRQSNTSMRSLPCALSNCLKSDRTSSCWRRRNSVTVSVLVVASAMVFVLLVASSWAYPTCRVFNDAERRGTTRENTIEQHEERAGSPLPEQEDEMSSAAWGGGLDALLRQGLEDMFRREREMSMRARPRRRKTPRPDEVKAVLEPAKPDGPSGAA